MRKLRFLISVLPLIGILAAAGCSDEGGDGPKLAVANVDASGGDGGNLNNDGGSDSTSPDADTFVDPNQCAGQPDGAACNDGNKCTDNDSCKGGTCVGSAKACDDKNLCTTDTCEPDTGCVFKNNAIACNDGDACTVGEICSGGKCQPGLAIKCDDSNKCTGDTCDPTKGCVFSPLPGKECNDGNACTTNDTCDSNGICASGPAIECDDGDPCTGDTCDKSAGGCQHVGLSGTACNDGIDGTIGDKCLNGKCLGNYVACNDGTDCTVDGFNAKTGKCENLDVVCDDKNPCTDDKCDPTKGCTFTNNTAACDDGDVCTSGDTCKAGTCVSGPGPSCDDQNACTVDKCDPTKGCTHLGLTGPVCDDGNACLVGEMCNGGVCAGGIAPVCNDNSACTKDTCDPTKGCVFIPLTGTACNDGNACTIGDQCSVSGVCLAGNVTLGCDDGNPCTTDSCDKAVVTGCVHSPFNGVACDDNNQYTTGDVCSAGVCKGTPIVCNDNNACTNDGGNAPDCVFAPIVCIDGNSCTVDNVCDPKTGCTFLPVAGTITCDDGNPCTNNDVCKSGTCTSGTVTKCDDNDPCTIDACVPAVGACNYNKIPGCGTGEICGNGIDDDGDLKIDCSDSECGPKMKNGKLAYEVAYVLYAYASWGGTIKFVTADQPAKVQEYALPADAPSPKAMSYTLYCNEVPFTATLISNGGGMLKAWTQALVGATVDEKIKNTPPFWQLGFWSTLPAKGPPAPGNGNVSPDGASFIATWPVQ